MLITVCIKEFNLRIFYSRGNIFINYHIIHPPSLKEHSAAYYSADNVTDDRCLCIFPSIMLFTLSIITMLGSLDYMEAHSTGKWGNNRIGLA